MDQPFLSWYDNVEESDPWVSLLHFGKHPYFREKSIDLFLH